MKVLFNNCYGGFGFSKAFLETHSVIQDRDCDRTSPELIKMVEDFGFEQASSNFSALAIALVPDEATDWWIDEYDGYESVYYVLDGKRHVAKTIDSCPFIRGYHYENEI